MDVLHLSAIVPATVAACCTVGERRRVLSDALPALLMVLSMLDLASGRSLLWPLAWAAILLFVAPFPVLGARRRRGTVSPGPAMALHRSLGLVVMATVTVGGGALGASASHHGVSGIPGVILVAGIGAFLAFTAVIVARTLRGRRGIDVVESASMALSVAMMAWLH